MEERAGCLRLEPGGPSWPAELEEIESPPEELWTRGQVEWLARRPRVGIVGTRAPTPYGVQQAERFARALAAAGVVVVSGLARGIDQAAHRGALDVGGATIAVLGSGVLRPWPRDETCERMLREALVLSEHAPETSPRPHHFPLRNRLISGLCAGVLVVEAAQRSGSLITAHWAADQGRSVWAIPGRVDHPLARGVHRLLREGAELVEDPEEILDALGVARSGRSATAGAEPSALERALAGETLTADELAERTALPLGEVLADLVALELDGRVVRAPGGLYRRR